MWKWIGRILAFIVLCLALAGWWGYSRYQKFTAGGNSTRVAIHASQDRVFASLANADSLSTWTSEQRTIPTERHGMLEREDVVRVRYESANGSSRSGMTWKVTEVRGNQLIAMEIHADTSPNVLATRRDSLVTIGDSTVIFSTVASPMFEAAQGRLRDSSHQTASAVVAMVSKVSLSVFRAQAENDLKRLKSRLERVLER